MRVLLHDSHADGSGAPGERDWVRQLNDRIVIGCWVQGIDVERVPGDLKDHPEFHEDYDAFVASHYDANIYGSGGGFWDSGRLSPTAVRDFDLGGLIWERLRAIPGFPPDEFGRRNANTYDYYGFRLTSENTPGVIVEYGVGAPGAPDHDFLREHMQEISDAVVLALSEFGGMEMGITGDQAKDLIREMLASEEGALLVKGAILRQPDGYGPALAAELDERFKACEAKSVVEAQLGVRDECLKPAP